MEEEKYEGANIFGHTETTPNAPQHNLLVERVNRTILDPVRTLLEEAGLSANTGKSLSIMLRTSKIAYGIPALATHRTKHS